MYCWHVTLLQGSTFRSMFSQFELPLDHVLLAHFIYFFSAFVSVNIKGGQSKKLTSSVEKRS